MKQPKKDKPKKKKDKQKKEKGFEFQKSNYGKQREEPTGKGFGTSDLIRGKANKKIKALQKRDRDIQKKTDSENQRHRPMAISQAEWEEKWEKIFESKGDKEDIEVKKE